MIPELAGNAEDPRDLGLQMFVDVLQEVGDTGKDCLETLCIPGKAVGEHGQMIEHTRAEWQEICLQILGKRSQNTQKSSYRVLRCGY